MKPLTSQSRQILQGVQTQTHNYVTSLTTPPSTSYVSPILQQQRNRFIFQQRRDPTTNTYTNTPTQSQSTTTSSQNTTTTTTSSTNNNINTTNNNNHDIIDNPTDLLKKRLLELTKQYHLTKRQQQNIYHQQRRAFTSKGPLSNQSSLRNIQQQQRNHQQQQQQSLLGRNNNTKSLLSQHHRRSGKSHLLTNGSRRTLATEERHYRNVGDPNNYGFGNAEQVYGRWGTPSDWWGPTPTPVSGSTDRYFYDVNPTALQQARSIDNREWAAQFRKKFKDEDWVRANIMHNQAVLSENIRTLENTALREKIYGATDWHKENPDVDRGMRNLDIRQRELIEKIYRQQIDAVVKEFEEDYAPMVAMHLRKQKRELFWQQIRHKLRWVIYPFSLTANALHIAWKIYRRRRDLDTRVGPTLFTDSELGHAKAALYNIRQRRWSNIFKGPTKRLVSQATTMFSVQKELFAQRHMAITTEMLRFKKYSRTGNNPLHLYKWFTHSSKYDPQQYELRRQITKNLEEGWKAPRRPTPHLRKPLSEYEFDEENPTMHLTPEDEQKLLHRLLHKFILHFRLTSSSYPEQRWWVRKLRMFVDAWYDYYKPNWYGRFLIWRKARARRKIEKVVQKEVLKQQKMEQEMLRELEKGKKTNSWAHLYEGIKTYGSVTQYIKYRFKLWFNGRRNATLYDVAKKNRRWFEGPSGPPFWRIYLQVRHLLRSPLGRLRVERLTVGQEDAKSFWRKWNDMSHDMRRYPKLRKLIWSAFHDNLMLRSTIYFRISRWLRKKQPEIEELKENYFKEIIRIYRSIFHKKERYSFNELYALSLQEWWYPTQNSIRKFDRFDLRCYDRWNDKDKSVFFSFSTLFLTFLCWSAAYAYSMGRRDYLKQLNEDKEKLFYTGDGAEMSHYADQLLYADRREFVFNELKYNGLMRLHDEILSRSGSLIDSYYSILDDARRERERERHEPATTIVYQRAELANIANVMKGKARDYELADDIIIDHVQNLWFSTAQIFLHQHDISLNPMSYTEDQRQLHMDMGHFLMSHIDKIAQSATFPEFEGLPSLSYILDDGLVTLRPQDDDEGITVERVFSQDQEERHAKLGYLYDQERNHHLNNTSHGVDIINPDHQYAGEYTIGNDGDKPEQMEKYLKESQDAPTKFLSLSEAVTYLDHTNDCALAKLARLESNMQMLIQLLDCLVEMQGSFEEAEEEKYRILEIPTASEINDMQEKGTFVKFMVDWHNKQRSLLPHLNIPQDFGEIKAKEILQQTGNKEAAIQWLHYYNRYVKPGKYTHEKDEFGTTQTAFDDIFNGGDLGGSGNGGFLYNLEANGQLETLDQLLHRATNIENHVERGMKIFSPHVNLIMQHINRLIQLRPRIYHQVKDDMVKKFVGLVDLDLDVSHLQGKGYDKGDARRLFDYSNRMNRFSERYMGGTIGELSQKYMVPMMMLQELKVRKANAGNLMPGTLSRRFREFHPKPSEMRTVEEGDGYYHGGKDQVQLIFEDEEKARDHRARHITTGLRRAITYDDPVWNIEFTPDNWDTLYEPMQFGWNLDELKQRERTYLQWYAGGLPTQMDLNPTPRAKEWEYQAITPFDENSYYDAWTDIYQLIARTKNKINSDHVPQEVRDAIPFRNAFIQEQATDKWDPADNGNGVSLIQMARKIPEVIKYKVDSYNLRTYGTDHEFFYNRKLFLERIDKYFRYFKFFLNRQWSRDILDTRERWRKLKRFLMGKKKAVSFYEDYFLSHGFYHFLTTDPVYAKYGNDFFFRYFIDAPKFDRRPMALVDQHRYDKDGEDIYFDALYNTRVLNNPWPLHVEHMQWSLKPWYDFVNAQFAVYRYYIVSDGQQPPEFPQMYLQDVEDYEKFVVPDQHYGYDAVWTWGKDMFDPTYKKQEAKYQKLFDKLLPNPQKERTRRDFLDFHENYRP